MVASNLRVDWATAEVLRAFEREGIRSLLLKGATFARWLYHNSAPRAYADCDLLVRPGDHARAERALAELGFEPTHDENEMPDWWHEHAVAWLRHSDAAVVDLHRTLDGVGVDAATLWQTLSSEAEPVAVADYEASALAIPGRAFHLALHAAQHGEQWGAVVDEVELAAKREDISTWRAAAALARTLDAEAAFATGLRLAPSGRGIADELDLSPEQPVGVALRARTPPPVALGLDQLSRADSLRTRFAILRHKFFPPPTFMRKWSPRAAESRRALVWAYVRRPIWLLRKAPAGFRAWRRARRPQRW